MNEKNQTIVIQISGDETIATRIPTGWPGDTVTRSRTTRHPKDQFDAYIAARVALDRVFGKDGEQVFWERDEEKTPELETPRWKVGDWIVATGSPICKEYWGKVGQVISVERRPNYCEYKAEFINPLGGRTPQFWSSYGPLCVRPATEAEIPHATTPTNYPHFQVGDIVRIVATKPPTFDAYELGDVAVVTEKLLPDANSMDQIYRIRVRSKERKGNTALVFGSELQLLHRDGKKGGTRG